MQAAGWDAIIVFNQVRPDDGQVNMLTGEGGIPGVHMRRVDAIGPEGVLANGPATPASGTAGPNIEVGQEFDGWGYAHLFDAKTGEELDAYAISEARDPRFADGFGDLSIHEFATDPKKNLAYAAYYAGGIRVFGFSREDGLDEVGAWIADGGSNFWGVEQFTADNGERLIAGSDRDFGLVILRYTGDGAVGPTPVPDPPGGDDTPKPPPRRGRQRRRGGGSTAAGREDRDDPQAGDHGRQEPHLQGGGQLPRDGQRPLRRHAARGARPHDPGQQGLQRGGRQAPQRHGPPQEGRLPGAAAQQERPHW